MDIANKPAKLLLPFASAGDKNAIPVTTTTDGAASLTDGFPAETALPIRAGGVPPSREDFNGALFEISAICRWAAAGGGYPYDSAFVGDPHVNGYPKGARILRADNAGYWLNTADANTTDPNGSGSAAAGWVPDPQAGSCVINVASSNVTLTPAQYACKGIIIAGVLTADINVTFPTCPGVWYVLNATTGGHVITFKSVGVGVAQNSGGSLVVFGDGSQIWAVQDREIPPPPTALVPTGMIAPYAGASSPTGWAYCDGSAVSRTTYADLFAAIGTIWGAGDGSTTFNLPDLRTTFLRGSGPGRSVGTQESQQVLAHKHMSPFGEFAGASGAPFGKTNSAGHFGSGGNIDNDNYLFMTNDGSDYDSTVNASGVIGTENRPANKAVMYIIKL